MMAFLRKHPVEVAALLLAVISIGLYLFLVRPVMMKKQKVIQATEEKIAQLLRYQDEPPSKKMIGKLSRENKRLGEQYKEVIKTLHFARSVSVPKVTGQLSLYFEEQLEEAGNELGGLAGTAGIKIPERLGFGKEKVQSKEELSLLLSQLAAAKELATLVINSGVSDLSVFTPLPLSSKGVTNSAGGEVGQGSGKSPFKELGFELDVRAKISVLTKLLYQLENYSFTVKNMKIKSVNGGEREVPSVSRRQVRRRRRLPYESLPEDRLKEKEKVAGPVELEAKLLVSTRLLPSNTGMKK